MLSLRPTHRCGTFILFIVGIASAIVLTATAFYAATGRSRLATGSLLTQSYAQQMALLAVNQASKLLVDDFLKASPTNPTLGRITNLDQLWRTTWFPDQKTGFPIHDSGQAPRPGGLEGHQADDYERFTPASDYLTQFYARVYDYRVGTYDYRANIYFAGYLNTPGVSRYFPYRDGSVYRDPAGNSTDPVFLDHRMQVVGPNDPTRRYMLRYAANIEDLSGHLLSACTTWDGTYKTDVAQKYERSIYIMGKFMLRYPSAECMRRFWMREPVNKAMMNIWVSDNWKDNSTWFQNIFNSTDPMTRDGETVLSWEPFEKVDPSNNGAEVPVGAYLLTPFGAITQQTNAPQKWYEGKTDCPWRINLPTATAPTIGLMLMGALPKEFHEQGASVPWGPPLTRTDGTWVLGDWTNYESG
ncbi:MAG: hypothetical protein N3A02_01590 [Rectinema sp.]|nr:hypothetical protein [Rectinema sp.]